MVKIELSEEEMKGLTEEEKEIAIARKLEIKILPLIRRNINFFYAGANIPKKAEAYQEEANIENVDENFNNNGQPIDTACRPLCEKISEILNESGLHAETLSCDTDIFRHTDVLITTSSGKQYIINYLEDIENIQTDMKTPDFASEQYYNRRYKKFEGTVTTDGKRLDNIAFIDSEELAKIDDNLGYRQYGMYMDDVIAQIRKEFSNFRTQMSTNEIMERNDITEDEKARIEEKWMKMSDDEVLERKMDWIFEYFNSRGSITGHTDFVMYYSRLLLSKVLTSEEYRKLNRYDCSIREDRIPDDSKLNTILDFEHQEDRKLRFCIAETPTSAYAFSTKEGVYLKLTEEQFNKIRQEAIVTKSEKPSDLVLLLADKGNALPLVFNPMGQKILNERAGMEDQDGTNEKLQELAKSIKCTDGRFADGKVTSMSIPYPDGSTRFLYIDENNELAEIQNGRKRIYHYDEEQEKFTIEDVKTPGTPSENGVPGWLGEDEGREGDL